jgi:hypothetical protein
MKEALCRRMADVGGGGRILSVGGVRKSARRARVTSAGGALRCEGGVRK